MPDSPTGPTGASGPVVPDITNFTLNQTEANANVRVVTQQGTSANGTEVTKVTLQTTAQDTDIKVTEDLAGKISAVDLVRAGVEALGGKGGGGRPDMAQGGGPDGAKAADAIAAAKAVLAG